MLNNSTPVPNEFFDRHLTNLKPAELKVLLVIIRSTLGWKNSSFPNQRKSKDWIAVSQFKFKTGLSAKAIGNAITSLQTRGLIWVSDKYNNILTKPISRSYTQRNFYALTPLLGVHSSKHNVKFSTSGRRFFQSYEKKVRPTKETITKEKLQKIEKIKTELRARWGNSNSLNRKDIL